MRHAKKREDLPACLPLMNSYGLAWIYKLFVITDDEGSIHNDDLPNWSILAVLFSLSPLHWAFVYGSSRICFLEELSEQLSLSKDPPPTSSKYVFKKQLNFRVWNYMPTDTGNNWAWIEQVCSSEERFCFGQHTNIGQFSFPIVSEVGFSYEWDAYVCAYYVETCGWLYRVC